MRSQSELEKGRESLSPSSQPSSEEHHIPHTWDALDDPDNPRNFPIIRRILQVVLPAWYALSITFGTSVYAPAVFDVTHKFHVSRTVALLGVSLYALGIALGPVLGAPISETFGRRWVYLVIMPPFVLFTAGAGLARKISSFLVCRFLASIFGAPAIAVGAGSVADLWDMQKGGAMAAMLFILIPFLGTSLGPLIGGFAVQNQRDWAWSMWVLIIIAGPAWIMAFFQKETYAKQILKKRALTRGLPQPKKPPPKVALKTLLLVTLLRPLHMLFFEPIVGWMSLYVAFAFGILFAFFDALPYVFGNIYHFDLSQIGLTYLSIIVGILLAAFTFAVIDRTLYAKSKARAELGKIPPPEERLYACMMGSIAFPISLFWFGWTSRPSIHWIVPCIAGLPFGWALVLLFLGASCYLVDAYQALNAASAIAANNFLRYALAAAFPLFVVQMYDRLGVDWGTSLLSFITLAMLPIPWFLYKWGPWLRTRSAYEMGNF